MGPLVSLGLWAVLGLMMRGVYQLALADPAWVPLGMVLVPWLGFASLINLFLFAFNMVPVQPLDGGGFCCWVCGTGCPHPRLHGWRVASVSCSACCGFRRWSGCSTSRGF
ncbi:hypothetical protein ACFSHQ_20725 [Gemmobacter lanyuensis]